MSNHLIDCAAQVQGLSPGVKLLLLCLADNARDGSGRIASPGLDKAMLWTGLSRTSTYEAFARLIELGLVEQVERGQKRRRAEFLLFPQGCCEVHARLDRQDLPGVSGSGTPDPETVDKRSQGPASRTETARQGPVEPLSGSGQPDRNGPSGSGVPDPFPRTTTQTTFPHPPTPQAEVAEVDPLIAMTSGTSFAELCAELRTIRRQHDQPTGNWTAGTIRKAVFKAVADGHDLAAVPGALRSIAADRETKVPGRLSAPGSWWDLPELVELHQRRLAREASTAAEQQALDAIRAACPCDRGWLEAPTGGALKCPTCHPANRHLRSHA